MSAGTILGISLATIIGFLLGNMMAVIFAKKEVEKVCKQEAFEAARNWAASCLGVIFSELKTVEAKEEMVTAMKQFGFQVLHQEPKS